MAKIKHVAITCEDPDAVAKFYKEGFDLFEVARNPRQIQLSDGDINLTILKWKTNEDADVGPNGENYDGIHHIGFQVDSLEETGAKLREISGEEIVRRELAGDGQPRPPRAEEKWSGPNGQVLDISEPGLAAQAAHGLDDWIPAFAGMTGSDLSREAKVMDASCVTHIGICVSDMDRSLAFYRDILGMTVLGDRMTDPTEGGRLHNYLRERQARRWVSLAYGDGATPTLTLTSHPGDDPDGEPIKLDMVGISHISFGVEDVKALTDELLSKGVELAGPIESFTNADGDIRSIYVYDPDGILVQFNTPH